MELRHLRYFVAVGEELNVSRASARLHVSQPAVSRQLKELEQETGVPLFMRLAKGLKFTDAGETFFAYAKDLLVRSESALQVMGSYRSNTRQSLTIGYIPTSLPSFLGEALRKFGENHPGIAVHLRELPPQQQIDALRQGTIDIALLGNPDPSIGKEFVTRSVLKVPISLVLPDGHPAARQRSADLSDLAREEFIGLSEQTFPGRNECIRKACQRVGFTPKLRLRGDSISSVLGLVAAGRGIAIMPEEASALPHPEVKFVRLRRPRIYAESVAVWKSSSSSRSLAFFTKVLCDHSASALPA